MTLVKAIVARGRETSGTNHQLEDCVSVAIRDKERANAEREKAGRTAEEARTTALSKPGQRQESPGRRRGR